MKILKLKKFIIKSIKQIHKTISYKCVIFKKFVSTWCDNPQFVTFLKTVPRWVERIARVYVYRAAFLYDKTARRLMIMAINSGYPDVLENVLYMVIRVTFIYYYASFDILSPEMLYAFFNDATPPSNDPALYLTAYKYTDATPLQLEQLRLGDMSLMSEVELNNYQNRHIWYEARQKVVNPAWYSVRADLIIFAITIACGFFKI